MLTVHFLGKILPQVIQVSANQPPTVKWEASDVGLSMEFTVQITNSQVDIECKTNRYTSEDIVLLYMRAFDICRATVNLVSFKMGYGLTVVLETLVDPNGLETTILPKDESLAALCTAFDLTGGFNGVLNMVLQDWRLYEPLNDLIQAITLPHVSAVNCGRVVERLRELIAPPGSDRKDAWKQMREALQVDEAYLKFVTDLSTDPRHGRPDHIPGSLTTEVTRRTWTVMNRYFEYRKNGSEPLPVSNFPLLTG